MVCNSLLTAYRYSGLRSGVPNLAWRALTAHPATFVRHEALPQRGLRVLAFKEADKAFAKPAVSGVDAQAHFSAAAAAASLRTAVPYEELTVGARSCR